ncbi:MAG: ATP-binding protein [Candidatus Cyclobacteriaceae bacterium M2_1C_046]
MVFENDKEIRVLLIEDDEDDYILTRDLFSEMSLSNFVLDWEPDYDKGREKILRKEYHIFLIDYRLGEKTGIDLLREARSYGNNNPIILLTGQGDKEVDLLAMREGAADYLVKGNIDANSLSRSLRYSLSASQAMQELNEKEKKYRNLFEKSIDAIFITNKELLFLDINSSMLKLLDYDKSYMLRLTLKDLFEDEKTYNSFNEELLRYGRTRDFEVELKKENGDTIECIINSTALLDVNNNLTGYQGIIHDISIRKRAEQELVMAEKYSMSGKIARSIAHEVRNPLTNLHLALEQLKEEVGDNNEMVELYSDIIKRNAERIDQLITELLSSSKPKQLELAEEDLNNVVDETLELTLDRINLKKMRLYKELNPSLPPLKLDKDKFKMALLNIIINAIEAMEEEKGVLEIKTSSQNGHVILTIKDNGKGIPKDDLTKLFDPFFTGKKSGMGLGLTTTQNIIKSHSGKIYVDSKVGEGTTFKITLQTENIKIAEEQ